MSTLGSRSTEWKLALGSVAAGVVLLGAGVYLAITGAHMPGAVGMAAGAALSAGASVGYSLSRARTKANQAATFRHRQV
jgi:NhaP-type Na+/H+ or K+/H+ antiporter